MTESIFSRVQLGDDSACKVFPAKPGNLSSAP